MKFEVEYGFFQRFTECDNSVYFRTSTHVVEAPSKADAKRVAYATIGAPGPVHVREAPDDAKPGIVGRCVNQGGRYRGY